jgi:hypothetical protein
MGLLSFVGRLAPASLLPPLASNNLLHSERSPLYKILSTDSKNNYVKQ